MIWREFPPLATNLGDELPEIEGVCLFAANVDDHREELWPEERDAITRARERRALEFATGRKLARCAMAELGLNAGAIARAEDRSPIWPPWAMGSITHAGEVVVAAVTAAGRLAGLGIDLEQYHRVQEPLYGKLFTAGEIASFADADPRLPGLLFSAKEAAYKAVNPRVGRFIGFQEAEVDVRWQDRTLRVRYVGDYEPNRIMDEGTGHFCFFEEFVLTVFVIPA